MTTGMTTVGDVKLFDSGVAVTEEASVWSEGEHAAAEVSSFPSSDLSFLQKQKKRFCICSFLPRGKNL